MSRDATARIVALTPLSAVARPMRRLPDAPTRASSLAHTPQTRPSPRAADYVAGGCCHEFESRGFTFDTGVHYVGRISKYAPLLDAVSDPDHLVRWRRVGSDADGYCYDEIVLDGGEGERPLRVPLRAGRDALERELARRFPKEKKAIARYLDLCVACNSGSEIHFFGKLFPLWLERLVGRIAPLGGDFEALAGKTVQQVLDSLTDDAQLKTVLAGQFGDYGMPPDEASFFIHAGVVAHYMGGAWYPVGGPGAIARAIVPVIERAGGRVLVKAPVAGVVVRPGTNVAVGVRLEGGEEVLARRGVVSDAGALNTYHRLLPEAVRARVLPQLPPAVREPAERGVSHLYCFVGFDRSADELRLTGRNHWYLPVGPRMDVNAMCREHYERPWRENGGMLLFIGFPAAKDPTYAARHRGRSNAIIITEARADWFDPGAHAAAPAGKRGAEYEALKARFETRMLEGLFRLRPDLREHVTHVELASPLTNLHYLRRSASYGLTHEPARYTGGGAGGLRPQSPVQRLWLTGQDVAANGFVAALQGGILTAHSILGYGALDLMVLGRNLIEDTMNIPAVREAMDAGERLRKTEEGGAGGDGDGDVAAGGQQQREAAPDAGPSVAAGASKGVEAAASGE